MHQKNENQLFSLIESIDFLKKSTIIEVDIEGGSSVLMQEVLGDIIVNKMNGREIARNITVGHTDDIKDKMIVSFVRVTVVASQCE